MKHSQSIEQKQDDNALCEYCQEFITPDASDSDNDSGGDDDDDGDSDNKSEYGLDVYDDPWEDSPNHVRVTFVTCSCIF